MITIGTVRFDFRTGNEAFYRSLYSGWEGFFRTSFEAVAEEVMSFYNMENEVLTIDSLPLDLGTIAEEDFYHLFPVRLREALHRYFRELLIRGDGIFLPGVSRVSTGQGALDLLCFFLLHGYLPFYADSDMTDIGVLLEKVLQTAPYDFRAFLECYAHYDFLHKRLALQFDDHQLSAIADIVRPSESKFAELYVRADPTEADITVAKVDITDKAPVMNMDPVDEPPAGGVEVENAGLVLFYPYYLHLFTRLDLYEEGTTTFKDDEARVKAIFLLQYVAYGDARDQFTEPELAFNRFLVNYGCEALPQRYRLSAKEKSMVDSMFEALKKHWSKIQGTRVEALRETFVRRKGILRRTANDTVFELQVEPAPYDVLIDSIPWTYSLIKIMNSEHTLIVKWRK